VPINLRTSKGLFVPLLKSLSLRVNDFVNYHSLLGQAQYSSVVAGLVWRYAIARYLQICMVGYLQDNKNQLNETRHHKGVWKLEQDSRLHTTVADGTVSIVVILPSFPVPPYPRKYTSLPHSPNALYLECRRGARKRKEGKIESAMPNNKVIKCIHSF
jgi:hypothetical protein